MSSICEWQMQHAVAAAAAWTLDIVYLIRRKFIIALTTEQKTTIGQLLCFHAVTSSSKHATSTFKTSISRLFHLWKTETHSLVDYSWGKIMFYLP